MLVSGQEVVEVLVRAYRASLEDDTGFLQNELERHLGVEPTPYLETGQGETPVQYQEADDAFLLDEAKLTADQVGHARSIFEGD